MPIRDVFVFGNPDLAVDSLPLRILPALREQFPKIQFQVLDPNEEWKIPEELVMLDTAVGLKEVKVFTNLDAFAAPPRVTMHDFDAFTNLRYLQKLGKLKKIKIIGLPPRISEKAAIDEVSRILR
ncbi:MAG: hypothetical protein AAB871_01995 [Patescibacteria group bacterium]